MTVALVVAGHGMAKEGREADPIAKMLLIMLVTGVMTSLQQMTGITRSIQVIDKSCCYISISDFHENDLKPNLYYLLF